MAISKTIRGISCQNYRCLPDTEIGPFARFNMIYGRNGSGKTSLAEAIQLCLTGWSFRAKNDADTKSVVARVSGEPVILQLFGPQGEIAKYDDGTPRPARPELLKTLYDIDAPGPKARFLLDQMFRTHNILYSEQIVAFLGAESAEKLCGVLRELMLGRDVLDIWDRITTAKQTADNVCDKLELDRSDVVAEIEDLSKQLKEVELKDSSNTEALALELARLMPPCLWEQAQPPTLGLNHESLTRVRQAIVRIEEAIHRCDAVRSLLAIRGSVENWGEVASRLREAKSVQTEANQKVSEAETRKKQLLDEISNTQDSLRALEPQREQLLKHIEKMDRCLGSLEHIFEWLSELQAEAKEVTLVLSIRESEKKLSKLEQAKEMLGGLPDDAEIEKMHQSVSGLSHNKKELEKRVAILENDREAVEKQLQEIESKTAGAASDRQRMFDLAVRLHESVKEFCRLRRDEVCPTCGTAWPSFEELYSAVERRFQLLTSELSPRDGDLPEYSDSLARLRHQIAMLETEQSSDQRAIEKTDEELVSVDAQLRSVKAFMNELRTVLDQVGIHLSRLEHDDPVIQARQFDSSSIESAISDLKDSIAQERAKLGMLWGGLRKGQWEAERASLRADIESLRNLLTGELDVPAAFESEEWSSLLAAISHTRDTLTSQRLELGNQMDPIQSRKASLERELQETEQSLSETRDLERAAKDDVKQWAEAAEHVRVLEELGLIKRSDAVSLTELADRLSDLNRKAKALLAEIQGQLTAHQERSQYTDQIEKNKQQQTAIEQDLKAASDLRQTFSQLTSPESFEQEIWEEYSDNISRLFKKLHWPPDFVEVSLRPEGDVSSLTVRLRDEPYEWKLASDRLSSGQRAALAIAVFWALNGRPENVPPLILMDEPIQSVDDLNVLNFLDSLRWLVEIGKRQVFLTTANRRIAGLIRRKFSYLREDFKEIRLTREIGLSQIEVFEADGNRIGKTALASASQ